MESQPILGKALNTAALFGQTDAAKLLLEEGADVSVANSDGSTALHIASFLAHEDLVELLLEKGASVSVNNKRGETPLDVVSGDWSQQLEGIYRSIGDLVDIELDLVRIRRTRPKIAERLRKRAAEQAGEDAGGAVPRRPSGSSWQTLPDMEVPRWEAGAVVFENRLYVFGGYKMPTKACKRVDAFGPGDNRWRKRADLPSAITHMNMVLDGRSVWFAGGFKDGCKGYAIREVWTYDIDRGPSLAC